MRRLWGVLIIIILSIIQTLPQLKIYGFSPDLLMILIIYYSFKVGTTKGIIFSAIIGALVDILSGSIIGTHVIAFSTIALSIEIFKTIFIFEMPLTVPIVSFISTITKYLILFLLSVIFGSISLGEWYIAMFIEGALNFIFAFPMVWVSKKIVSLLHREYSMVV
ncbi:MAG: rod shape-determining protein MreD [Spirochaetia bacterium]|nr:rod shape-determining protein MreD [Spirochaetota bacterium]MCX8097082.1 rod shape-determining protein MreD [Spirochaetota bacterium]MDW8113210.1 rod shape-determining protein MreD [Spirochaetia bacterium]